MDADILSSHCNGLGEHRVPDPAFRPHGVTTSTFRLALIADEREDSPAVATDRLAPPLASRHFAARRRCKRLLRRPSIKWPHNLPDLRRPVGATDSDRPLCPMAGNLTLGPIHSLMKVTVLPKTVRCQQAKAATVRALSLLITHDGH